MNESSNRSKVVIRLLGEFHVTYNDQPVISLITTRLQSLLAYLLLHHDIPQPRSHLAYLFWPDSSESRARNNLRQLLYQFRQLLPEHSRFLSTDGSTLSWTVLRPLLRDWQCRYGKHRRSG